LLLHGGHFGTQVSLEAFSLCVPVLAREWRTIALDRLGQGHTDNPRRAADYTVEATLAHVTGFLDALSVGPVHLIGHSRGGLLGVLLACREPRRVASLTIVDSHTASPTDTDGRFPPGVFYEAIEREKAGREPTFETVRIHPLAQAHEPRSVTDAYVARLLEAVRLPKTAEATATLEGPAAPLWRASLAAARAEATRRIDEEGLPVPTLVCWGRHDRSAPLELGIELFERIAARTRFAEMHVFGRSAHAPFRDEPARFSAVVGDFLGRAESPIGAVGGSMARAAPDEARGTFRGRTDGLDNHATRWIDVQGSRTRYYDSGDGPPLVLLHGGQYGGLYSLDAWSLNLPTLARWFRVIAPDRLGQGMTDNPARDADYRMAAAIDHVWSFLDALGIDRFHLVGHSRGGLAAAAMAVGHPGRVRSLSIVDSHTAAPPDTDAEFPPGVFYTTFVLPRADPPTIEVVRAEPEAQARDPKHITPDFERRLLELAMLPKAKLAQAAMQREQGRWLASVDAVRNDVTRVIDAEGFGMPTLVVWGLQDRSVPARLGVRLYERVAARAARAEFRLISGGGHYIFRECPDAFEGAIAGFCESVEGQGGRHGPPERL
jgi:pimeloyl-ACP methyl ester carboxylesterase